MKVVDVRDITKLQSLEGHSKSVRAVTWSPDGQLIASGNADRRAAFSVSVSDNPFPLQTTSGCDGQIRVWDVSNPNEHEPQCIRVIDGLIGEEGSDATTQSHAIWHPSGRYFVVGTKSHGMWYQSPIKFIRLMTAFDRNCCGFTGNVGTRRRIRQRGAYWRRCLP